MSRKIILPALAALTLLSCEKEVVVDLPATEPKLVVEGTIEKGQPPIVLLTRTQSYFAPTDLNSIASIFVSGAHITVNDGTNTVTLQEIAFAGLTPELLAQAAELTGIDPTLLASISVYSLLDGSMIGESGRTYTLNVTGAGKNCSAVTTVPNVVPWDSTWWRLAELNADDDSSGYVWGRLSDPDTLGNGYRHYGRRIYSQDTNFVEDSRFISPLGTTFDDKYLNGLTVDLFAVRGRSPFTDNSEDKTAGFFLRGDTVIMKLVSMGLKEADFYITYDNNVASQGDIFSTPANARTNINGGLGIWAGWAAYYDTLVCQ
jgi:Domain of unknown function (DUF4249)